MSILYKYPVSFFAGCNQDHWDWQDQGRLCPQEPSAWGTAHAPAAPPQHHPAVWDYEIKQSLLSCHGGRRGGRTSLSRQKWFKGEETLWGSCTIICETAGVRPPLSPLHWHCTQVRETVVYLWICYEAWWYSSQLSFSVWLVRCYGNSS